jgi:hypothetical protein
MITEVPRLLWVSRFMTVCRNPPVYSILSQLNPVHTVHSIPSRFIDITYLSYHLRLGLRNCFFPSGFSTKCFFDARLEVFRAMKIHVVVIWVVTLFNSEIGYNLHPEDGGSMVIGTVIRPHHFTVSYPTTARDVFVVYSSHPHSTFYMSRPSHPPQFDTHKINRVKPNTII